MTVRTIKAKDGRGEKATKSIAIDVNVPETLDELVAAYGAEVVAALASKRVVADLQAIMRAGLAEGKSDEDINGAVNSYKPSTTRRARTSVSPYDKLMADIQNGKLSPEQLAALKTVLRKG